MLGFVADNVSATLGADGGGPSRCVWVDTVRREYAAFLEVGAGQEYYVPAQHNTLHCDLVAGWQEASDGLAHDGLSVAHAGSVPLPALLGDTVLLLRSGVLVCDAVRALDNIYASECASRGPRAGPFDSPCWIRCLQSRGMQPAGLKFAYWLRAGPHTHRSAISNLHCYVCHESCPCWGTHMWHDCVAVALAVWAGWQALADLLEAQWLSLDTVQQQGAPTGVVWRLVHPDLLSDPL